MTSLRLRSRAARVLARLAVVFMLACIVLGSSGCPTKPVVSLHHAEITTASFNGIGLTVYLQIRNDNSYDVQIRNVRLQVVLADKYPVTPIDFSPNVWLPAKQTTIVAVPTTIPLPMLLPLLGETVSTPSIKYHVTGQADVTAVRMLGINRNDYPVDEENQISRQQLIDTARPFLPPFLPF